MAIRALIAFEVLSHSFHFLVLGTRQQITILYFYWKWRNHQPFLFLSANQSVQISCKPANFMLNTFLFPSIFVSAKINFSHPLTQNLINCRISLEKICKYIITEIKRIINNRYVLRNDKAQIKNEYSYQNTAN